MLWASFCFRLVLICKNCYSIDCGHSAVLQSYTSQFAGLVSTESNTLLLSVGQQKKCSCNRTPSFVTSEWSLLCMSKGFVQHELVHSSAMLQLVRKTVPPPFESFFSHGMLIVIFRLAEVLWC